MQWKLTIPYLAGAVIFLIGIVCIRGKFSKARGIDKIILLGPMFVAIAMAIFGGDHFVFAQMIVPLVPSWIPGHLFWVLLVGICLVAGGLSLVTDRYAELAAALFALMLLCFVLLLWLPQILHQPGDRFGWAYGLRDLSFACGAFAFAASRAPAGWTSQAKIVLNVTRVVIGLAAIFFAVEHFLHPEFVPGVPLELPSPVWFPGRVALGYLTGVILLIAGAALVVNKWTKLAATWLGAYLLLLTIVFYLPLVIAQPWSIENGLNYFADTLMYSGSVLCLAESYRAN
jgi:uncharacterized membrane protein